MTIFARRPGLLSALAACSFCWNGAAALAGPFSDWWGHQQAQPVYPLTPAAPVTNVQSGYAGYGYNGFNAYSGYPNTSYSPILPLSAPQTVGAYLPTGAYGSQYYKAPTTYYRPVTTFDPNLGTTVTSLQPCQSYQYQAQRIPLLTPAWQNYAYGGYGSTVPQNRWAPVTPPTYQPNVASPVVGSAAGQSGLSIASGFGTYGNSPVVQPSTSYAYPAGTFAGATPNPILPLAGAVTTPIVSGYGGLHSGIPTTSTTVLGTGVVPAASWSNAGTIVTPIGPSYTTPAVMPSTTAAPMPGSMGLPAIPSAVSPTVGSTYAGSTYNNGSIYSGSAYSSTPVAPGTSYPSSGSALPSTSYPPYPSTSAPYNSTVMPPVLPSEPAPTNVLPYNAVPSASSIPGSNASIYDSESTTVPSLNLSQVQSPTASEETSEKPRFQLRSVEKAPQNDAATTASKPSPWTMQESHKPDAGSKSEMNKPSELQSVPEKPAPELKLDLNTESLRPIPAPSGFNAEPDWKPSLLNARDQTAKQSELRPVRLEAPSSMVQPVQFLQHIRPVPSDSSEASPSSMGIQILLRPIK
jgi:hypothetical protein